ncbi:MAG: phage tail protein, partial [Fusobacterium sp.]
MAFRNLTNIGKEYLATRLANQLPVKFTKAKIGNGSVPLATDPAQTTDLYGLKKQVTILKTIQEQNSIKLTVQITNDEINEGFYLKEIGIYVDDNGKEVLYWYCNEDNSQYINAQTDTPLSFEVDIVMEVTNINSTVVEWTGKDTWVNKTLLNEEMAKKLNNGNLPATFTNAETILKALQGNTGIKFDENLLYLNDVGTKKKGLCYLDKLTDGIFECIQETTTTVNNATYFKNFSNKENSDRLSNLKIKLINDNQNYK